jgi:hypothetical protein
MLFHSGLFLGARERADVKAARLIENGQRPQRIAGNGRIVSHLEPEWWAASRRCRGVDGGAREPAGGVGSTGDQPSVSDHETTDGDMGCRGSDRWCR